MVDCPTCVMLSWSPFPIHLEPISEKLCGDSEGRNEIRNASEAPEDEKWEEFECSA
jgi:hypothetical protein